MKYILFSHDLWMGKLVQSLKLRPSESKFSDAATPHYVSSTKHTQENVEDGAGLMGKGVEKVELGRTSFGP